MVSSYFSCCFLFEKCETLTLKDISILGALTKEEKKTKLWNGKVFFVVFKLIIYKSWGNRKKTNKLFCVFVIFFWGKESSVRTTVKTWTVGVWFCDLLVLGLYWMSIVFLSFSRRYQKTGNTCCALKEAHSWYMKPESLLYRKTHYEYDTLTLFRINFHYCLLLGAVGNIFFIKKITRGHNIFI